jgi:cholesterol oxidase
MGRDQQFCCPNIAVDFGPPNQAHKNKFNAEQRGCTYCGDCDIGCNVHAKNTLDFNYLKVAQDRGADISRSVKQSGSHPVLQGHQEYQVTFLHLTSGGQLDNVTVKYVFVCGGAVNSTELLLRCRDHYRTLRSLRPAWLSLLG